ncbi:fruiting body spore coat protein U [Myxococcus sp. MISCRS1]|uniref:fruiting body development fimbrial-like coat protein PRU n=1 Tax=unclassified Myxococcus TaxID=2648731 RepID=UPI001CBFEFDC|nr:MULTISPECIES: fruiting body spore coat protein U [unclassified Myxococcus]MBZ4409918.1 fruiting body spore coat protein U [Myxococcus sp. XM-1-1-1]MCY0997647.1 fruiting body spore coat protein U [Myxococcus sp. MISCRS1]
MKAIQGTLAAATAAAALFTATSADAATATANLTVTATVASACTINSGTLNFGNYDPVVINSAGGIDLLGTGTLTVQCTLLGTAVVTLGQGTHAATGSTDAVPRRRMRNTNSNDYLAYDLYQDLARLVVWGNTAGTGLPYIGTGLSTPVIVYGTVARGQVVPSGTYSDTVVATITF